MLHRVCAFITACILGVTGWGSVRVYAGNGLSEGTARDSEKYYSSVNEDTGIERMSSKNVDEQAILEKYVSQKKFMYGKTCTNTVSRVDSGGGVRFANEWTGISSDDNMGYCIQDFDGDGGLELFIVSLNENLEYRLEMYEVSNGKVNVSDRIEAVIESSDKRVKLPLGRSYGDGLCGLSSCFVRNSDHTVYIQTSDSVSVLSDGNATYIISARYKDGRFTDYQSLYTAGSGIESSLDGYNADLGKMGVPNPDFSNIFSKLSPLYECFDETITQVFKAEQHTASVEKNGSLVSKVVTALDFSDTDVLNIDADKEKKGEAAEEEKDPWVCIREDIYGSIGIAFTECYEYDEKGRCIYTHYKSTGSAPNDQYTVSSYSDNKESFRRYNYYDSIPFYAKETELDADGKIVSVREASNGQPSYSSQYSYDGDLLMSVKKTYLGESTLPGISKPKETLFTYENGQLIQEQFLQDGELLYTTYYEYDSAGNLIDQAEYVPDKTGNIHNRQSYKYNEANQIIEFYSMLTGPESFEGTSYYTYDEYGNRTCEYSEGYNGEKELGKEYTYVRLSEALKMPRDARPDFVV